MRQDFRLDVSAIVTEKACPVDLLADAKVRERPGPAVSHEDRRVSGLAIRASMETSAVRIDAEAEGEIGAVVLRDDRARLLFEDLELHFRRLSEPFRVSGFPGVGRIGDPSRHAPTIA
jgi:hypothetical protein